MKEEEIRNRLCIYKQLFLLKVGSKLDTFANLYGNEHK